MQTSVGSQTDTQQFCYDDLSRLTWSGTNGTPPCSGSSITAGTLTAAQYQQSESYNVDGGLVSGPASSYNYGDSAHPHAVTSTSNGYSATYDAAGNLLCRALTTTTTCSGTSPSGQQLSYDAQGRLSIWQNQPTSPTQTVNYLYDGSGNRVAMQSTVNGSTTLSSYIGSIEEVQSSGSSTQTTTYYSVGGKRVAADVNGTFYYFGYDALGSQVAVLNASGSLIGAQLYGPYGSSRYSTGTVPTSIGFTGQRIDSTTGLDYYNARYYDPTVGQFLSVDGVQGNAQGMNPYAYVGGNPESMVDPTGQMYRAPDGSTAWINPDGTIYEDTPSNPKGPVVIGHTHSWGPSQSSSSGGTGQTSRKNVTRPAGPTSAQAKAAADTFRWEMCMSSDACSSNYWKERASYAAQKTLADVMLAASLAEALINPSQLTYWEDQEQTLDSEMETEEEVATAMQGVTCSFAAQTAVTTVHGKQEISKLHPGEKVWAYNPKTHKMEWQPIVHVWVTHDTDLVNLTIIPMKSGQTGKEKTQQGEVIQTNQKHRFLTSEKGFLPVGEIVVGMHIVQADGGVGTVTRWQTKPGSQTMYNLEVARDHTYVVGNQQWVVHNECYVNQHIAAQHVDRSAADLVAKAQTNESGIAGSFFDTEQAEQAIQEAIDNGEVTETRDRVTGRLIWNVTYSANKDVGYVAFAEGSVVQTNKIRLIFIENSTGWMDLKTVNFFKPTT